MADALNIHATGALLNSLIGAINRLGRGYSFETLRAKFLFTEGSHKERNPKYQKHILGDTFLPEHLMLSRPQSPLAGESSKFYLQACPSEL